MKLLFFLMILLSNHAYASVWQDQATAFREYADQLANNKYPDYRKAYHFYCVSTAMNEKQAAYEIANLYLHGHGVEASLPIAKGWLVYSAKLGHQQAVDKLKEYPEIISTNDPFCPKHDASKKMNKKDIQAWVTLISPTFGLDPQMVNAVITVESGFNPKAISKKNARGLMQLLPSTAKRLGVKNSFDPVQNMIGGITYLRYLLQMFSGDLVKTWAAYNAGEHAVIRNKGIPPIEETIQYVRTLLVLYPRTFSPIRTELPFVFNKKTKT